VWQRIFQVGCKFDLKLFPFDKQTCNFTIGSNNHDGTVLDVVRLSLRGCLPSLTKYDRLSPRFAGDLQVPRNVKGEDIYEATFLPNGKKSVSKNYFHVRTWTCN